MGNSIFGIGLSGLNAAQAGLLTTGHNISNISTPGYNRQQVVQGTNIPQQTGAGFFGQGVQVSGVKRIYSQFLSNQVSQAQTQSSQLDAYYSQIQQINNMLGDPSSGLSPALQSFFAARTGCRRQSRIGAVTAGVIGQRAVAGNPFPGFEPAFFGNSRWHQQPDYQQRFQYQFARRSRLQT